jgi:hypothetical protein
MYVFECMPSGFKFSFVNARKMERCMALHLSYVNEDERKP